MMHRSPEQNRELHRLLTLVELEAFKEDLVSSFTQERTTSSSQMSFSECAALIDHLKKEDEKKHGKSRRTILHQLKLLGWDYKRIDKFIENIGSNNPKKKSLNSLGGAQLNAIVTQVKQLYHKETSKK
jgi:hypothetical protein